MYLVDNAVQLVHDYALILEDFARHNLQYVADYLPDSIVYDIRKKDSYLSNGLSFLCHITVSNLFGILVGIMTGLVIIFTLPYLQNIFGFFMIKRPICYFKKRENESEADDSSDNDSTDASSSSLSEASLIESENE